MGLCSSARRTPDHVREDEFLQTAALLLFGSEAGWVCARQAFQRECARGMSVQLLPSTQIGYGEAL
jgi:hypothetical protein